MEAWREIILPLNSILLWERSWYPGLIFGITTSIFLMIWMMEPALLTLISISLLLWLVCLFLIDHITQIMIFFNLSNSRNWTGQKEKKFNEICQNLSITILQLQHAWRSIVQTRNDRPNIYYGITTICLILLAWIGNTIDNLFLLYVAVNTILLIPGLRHKGHAMSVVRSALDYFSRPKES